MRGVPNRPCWTDRYKQNWDDTYERMMAWWEGESLDQPVILSSARKPGSPPLDPAVVPATPEQDDLEEAYCLARHRHHFDTYYFLAEAAPYTRTLYGSDLCLLPAMAGAAISYAVEWGTTWIEKVDCLYERALPEFDPDSPPMPSPSA